MPVTVIRCPCPRYVTSNIIVLGRGMQFDQSFVLYTRELSHKRYTPLTAERERELLAQYSSGSVSAREQLINAHLRFVVYLLRDYKIPNTINIMDIIQEGNCGLMEGIKRFDSTTYTCRVATFAFIGCGFILHERCLPSRSSRLYFYIQ